MLKKVTKKTLDWHQTLTGPFQPRPIPRPSFMVVSVVFVWPCWQTNETSLAEVKKPKVIFTCNNLYLNLLLTFPPHFISSCFPGRTASFTVRTCCNVIVIGARHAWICHVSNLYRLCASVPVKPPGLLPPIKCLVPSIKPKHESEWVWGCVCVCVCVCSRLALCNYVWN